jgi:hypothetical protein
VASTSMTESGRISQRWVALSNGWPAPEVGGGDTSSVVRRIRLGSAGKMQLGPYGECWTRLPRPQPRQPRLVHMITRSRQHRTGPSALTNSASGRIGFLMHSVSNPAKSQLAFRPGLQFTAVHRRVSASCYEVRPSARRLEGIGPTSGYTSSDAGKLWLSQDFRPTAVPIAAVLRVATRSAPAMMMM